MELGERSRTIVNLSYYEDNTDAEIASIIGSKRSTIRDYRTRSLNILRAKLAEFKDKFKAEYTSRK